MGVNLSLRYFNKCDENELKQKFDQIVSNLKEMRVLGSKLSGDWDSQENGLEITEKEFRAEEEDHNWTTVEEKARNWINFNTKKGDNVKAVKVFEDIEPEECIQAVKEIDDQIQEYHAIIKSCIKNRLFQMKCGSHSFHTCPVCRSKIATIYLKSDTINCPICDNEAFMVNKTIAKEREKYNKKINELSQKKTELFDKKKNSESQTWKWLVGGWCAE